MTKWLLIIPLVLTVTWVFTTVIVSSLLMMQDPVDEERIRVVNYRIPWISKLNPLWWFKNDPEPSPPDWYLPGHSLEWRTLCWYFRNPLVNFNDYVLGVADRNFYVQGPKPVNVPDWLYVNPPREGFKWSVIEVDESFFPRPFVSYTGKKRAIFGGRRILWHLGWEPGGSFATKFNITAD